MTGQAGLVPGRLRLPEASLADVRPVLADPSTPPMARQLLTVVANPGLRPASPRFGTRESTVGDPRVFGWGPPSWRFGAVDDGAARQLAGAEPPTQGFRT
ncbi:MAG: hypothetical protein WBA97_01175, partial [Actinophytocola sp.]|uniref:hypothetical protein n=1 Tax=Actinophytocola sp. TaxID=1872138 RepID=UPI003C7585FD